MRRSTAPSLLGKEKEDEAEDVEDKGLPKPLHPSATLRMRRGLRIP
jgi:hypothetical protein